jgi:hypothetical protein
MMLFDDVRLISQHIEPASLADVQKTESELGIQLPAGYTEFITRFGAGMYCDLFRIYTPDRIPDETRQHREWWLVSYYEYPEGERHWFFEGSEAIISPEQLQASFMIGDSIDGDNLVFYPPQPDKLFILPRHDTKIDVVRSDLNDLHGWDSPAPRLRAFQPWHRQTAVSCVASEYSLTQSLCLEQFKQRWGQEHIFMLDDSHDATDWMLIFFLPPIGGRVQITGDELTGGTANPSLALQIWCDEEAEPEVLAFTAHLETQGLCKWG